MLEPDSRHLLLDALRPPDSYSLDLAVGTTYSLDLGALLTAPLAFAMFDAVGADDPTGIGPLALLEAARRHADRITLFCQAGGIALPRRRSPALVYLEGSVVEVGRPAPERVFHPKLWVLRYRAPDGPLLHRVLCLSRNLTFDRSWDLVLRLDEQPGSAAGDNQPLRTFLIELPGLALRAMPHARLDMLTSLAATVAGAGFAPPEGFDKLEFWPLGGPAGRGWPFPSAARRVLVVSPFVTATMLNRIAAGASRATLVSRPESIDELGEPALRCYNDTFVVSELADPAADDATAPAAADLPPDPVEEPADVPARGLHAKAYVTDHTDQATTSTVWVGSANATHAAFSGNVEFLVALTGPTRRCGVRACLGTETDPQALRRLLVPYPPPQQPLPRSLEQQVQDQLEGLGIDMAAGGATLTVGAASGTDGPPRYPLTLRLARPPAGARARAWPVTLPPSVGARTIDPVAGTATWDAVAAETITPFIAVELTATGAEGGPSATTFVLIADLIGAPTDRQARALASIVQTSQDFLRYLLLLLADSGVNTDAWLALQEQLAGDRGRHARRGWSGGFPVLEALLRTLSRDPDALDHVARLVDDLAQAPDGTAVVPEDFQLIWDPVRTVRQATRR
jgi:hypothetical protein